LAVRLPLQCWMHITLHGHIMCAGRCRQQPPLGSVPRGTCAHCSPCAPLCIWPASTCRIGLQPLTPLPSFLATLRGSSEGEGIPSSHSPQPIEAHCSAVTALAAHSRPHLLRHASRPWRRASTPWSVRRLAVRIRLCKLGRAGRQDASRSAPSSPACTTHNQG